ncbi:MAG: hypothetical protein QM571_07110 [Micrococcaceae bacterium]
MFELVVLGLIIAGAMSRKKTLQQRRELETPHFRREELPAPTLMAQSDIDRVKELDAKASAALVDLDDALRAGDEELNFAIAEFGEVATTRYKNGLVEANYQLKQSYSLRQIIDSSRYSSLVEAQSILEEIIGRSEESLRMLELERSVFDDLREQRDDVEDRLSSIREDFRLKVIDIRNTDKLLEKLKEKYAPIALQEIEDNVEQAKDRVIFAENEIDEAQDYITTGNKGMAVMKVRYAEHALMQTQQLVDSVQRRAEGLKKATKSLYSKQDELNRELAEANKIAEDSKHKVRIQRAIVRVENTIQEIKDAEKHNTVNPFDASRKINDARVNLEESLAIVRDEDIKKVKAQESLDHALLVAESQISATEDFIMARRGAVGADARVKLALAKKTYEEAKELVERKVVKSLDLAHQAEQLATESAELAKVDVRRFNAEYETQDKPTTGAALGGMLLDSLLNKGNKNY